jgi:hypothetical protein
VTEIQEIFSWHRSRAKCMASMTLARIRLRSVYMKSLAQEFYLDAQQDSNDCRNQRFFCQIPCATSSLPARWWTRSGKRHDGETLPRSHQLKVIGKKISIFDNGLHYRGCAFSLLWECLEHPGNSSTRLRVHLVHRVKKLFGPKCKLTLLADREFLGND